MAKKEASCCLPSYTFPLYQRLLVVWFGILLWYLLSHTDATSLLWSTEISDNLRVIFLLWLVASVSTCLAVTWWIVVWYTDLSSSEHPWKTQAWLHGWRVFWFIVFGAILWLIWEQVSYSLWFTAWLNVIISWILLLLALQILWLLPKWKRDTWVMHKMQHAIQKYSSYRRSSSLVWAITFFVPCWFTQMVQIMALASGSLLQWSLIMWVFALWTLPWLILLWVGTSYLKTSHKRKFEWIVALILIAFSLYSIQGSMGLLWVWDMISWSQNSWIIVSDETEIILLWHDGTRLIPENTVLTAGKSYDIRITPDENGLWCMSSIALPSIDKNIYPVQAWEEIRYVLENPPPWTYTFVCSSMWMSQWKIVVQ